MTKEEHTGRKLAIGALFAAIAGYLAGILTAPKSGKETREDIGNKAGEIKEESVEQLKSAQAELEELLGKAKSKTVALSAKAREEFNEAVVQAKDAKNKSVAVIKAAKAGGSDEPELDKAIKQASQARKNLAKYFKA